MLPADRRRRPPPPPPEMSADDLRDKARKYAASVRNTRTLNAARSLRRLERMYEQLAAEKEAADPDQTPDDAAAADRKKVRR